MGRPHALIVLLASCALVVLVVAFGRSRPAFADEPAKVPLALASGPLAVASGQPVAAVVPESDKLQLNTPMTVGLTIISLTYVPCLILGPLTEEDDLYPLMVPIAGPLIMGSVVKASDAGWIVLGALSGLQAVGAGILAFGSLLPRQSLPPSNPKKKPSISFRAAPLIGPTTWGLAAQGSF